MFYSFFLGCRSFLTGLTFPSLRFLEQPDRKLARFYFHHIMAIIIYYKTPVLFCFPLAIVYLRFSFPARRRFYSGHFVLQRLFPYVFSQSFRFRAVSCLWHGASFFVRSFVRFFFFFRDIIKRSRLSGFTWLVMPS